MGFLPTPSQIQPVTHTSVDDAKKNIINLGGALPWMKDKLTTIAHGDIPKAAPAAAAPAAVIPPAPVVDVPKPEVKPDTRYDADVTKALQVYTPPAPTAAPAAQAPVPNYQMPVMGEVAKPTNRYADRILGAANEAAALSNSTEDFGTSLLAGRSATRLRQQGTALAGQEMQSDATMYGADRQAASSKYGQELNAVTSKYGTDSRANAAIAAAKLHADATGKAKELDPALQAKYMSEVEHQQLSDQVLAQMAALRKDVHNNTDPIAAAKSLAELTRLENKQRDDRIAEKVAQAKAAMGEY